MHDADPRLSEGRDPSMVTETPNVPTSTMHQPTAMTRTIPADSMMNERRRGFASVAKEYAIIELSSMITRAIGVLKCDPAVPRIAIAVLRKSYDEKSLGNLARWNFETRDQGGNNASGIAAEDEGTDKWTRSRNQTTKQANTSTIHDMIKAIILAIGNWPSGDKVPDAVRSVLESHYQLEAPLGHSKVFDDDLLLSFIRLDDIYVRPAAPHHLENNQPKSVRAMRTDYDNTTGKRKIDATSGHGIENDKRTKRARLSSI